MTEHLDVVAAVRAEETGRDPLRLALRHAAMRATPVAFLRATCGLFHARAHRAGLLPDAPVGWLCGDLHLENFGSYRGSNHLAYFDLNDFDEALLGPGTWDILRLATSVLVWTADCKVNLRERRILARSVVDAFAAGLAGGKPHWIERATAEGPVRELLRQVKRRNQRQQLAARLERRSVGGHHRLRLDPAHTFRATREERQRITKAFARFAVRHDNPRFYRIVDVARRIAGLGSLGLPRWVVVVWGDGSPSGYRLIDVKAARQSSASKYSPVKQPDWPDDATRVVTVQRWMQAESPARLATIRIGHADYILRELQPELDRLHLGHLDREPDERGQALRTMGSLAAWAVLRSAGRKGAAVIDELAEFARHHAWRRDILSGAEALAGMVAADWREFSARYDAGELGAAGI